MNEVNLGLFIYEILLKSNWVIIFLMILIIIILGLIVIWIFKNINKFFIYSIDVLEKDKENFLKSIK